MKKFIAVVSCVILGNVAQAGGSFTGPAINLGQAAQTLDAKTSSTAYRTDDNNPTVVTPYNQSNLNKDRQALDLDVRYGYEFFPNAILAVGLGFNDGSAKADYSKTNVIPAQADGNNNPLGLGGVEDGQTNTTSSSVKKGNTWSLYISPGYRFNFNQSALGSDWLAYAKVGGYRSSYEFTMSGTFSRSPLALPNSNPENTLKKNVTGLLWGLGLAKEFGYSSNPFLRHLNVGLEWRRLESNYSTGAYEVFSSNINLNARTARSTVEVKLRPLDMYVFSVGYRF